MSSDITITRVNTTAGDDSTPPFTTPVYDPAVASATADIDAIDLALSGGNDADIRTDAGAGGNGDIAIAAGQAISSAGASGAKTLRLNAGRNIIVGDGVTIQHSGGTPGTDKLDIVFNADSDANGVGRIALSGTAGNLVTLATSGGNIWLGGRDSTLTGAITGVATGNATNGEGVQLSFATLNADAGSIGIFGKGGSVPTGSNVGVRLSSASLFANGGITISGTGSAAGGGSGNAGVLAVGTGNSITSVTGDIAITGVGAGTAIAANGVTLSNTLVGTSGSGNIRIDGTASATATNNALGIFLSGATISSTGASPGAGTITLIGSVPATATGNGNRGVSTQLGTNITSAVGDISITGTGGGSGSSNEGVLLSGGSVTSTGAAAISITGIGGGTSVGIMLNTGATVRNTSGQAGITLTADGMALGATSSVSNPLNSVTLQTLSAGRAINLGSATDLAGALALSTSELGIVQAGTLIVGRNDAGASGDITISSAIVPAGTTSLVLKTGGSITQDAGATIVETNLGLVAGTGVTLTEGGNNVTTLAGLVTGGGDFSYVDLDAFTVSGNAAVNADTGIGIQTANGSITLQGTRIDLAADIVTNGTGSAARAVTITGPVVLAATAVRVDTQASGLQIAGNVTFANAIDGTTAGTHTLLVDAGGNAFSAGGAVLFGGAVGAGTPLSGLAVKGHGVTFGGTNDVDTLAIALSGAAGAVSYTDGDDLTVGSVSGVAGITTNDGNVTLTASGFLTLAAAVGAGSGTVTLTAGDAITLNAAVTTTGALALDAAGLTTIGVVLGDTTRLASVTTDAPGTTLLKDTASLGVTVGTTGGQAYNDALRLDGNVFLVSDAGGAITFAATVDASAGRPPSPLTVSTAGSITFGGAVGGTNALDALTTNGGGPIAIDGGSVRTNNAQHYDAAVTLGAATAFTGSSVGFDGAVDNGGHDLALTTDSGTFGGVITGGGGFTLASLSPASAASAVTTLSAANLYTGATTINSGILLVTGSIAGSATTVNGGGTLAGTGTVGAVIVNGGTLSPGASPGILDTGDLSFAGGGILKIELGGTTAGSGYDQLRVAGTVGLVGATLQGLLFAGFDPAAAGAARFTIIDNDGADAVAGSFTGLAEGARFNIAGHLFTISYQGGDGNDVVLSVANDAPTIGVVSGTIAVTEDVAAAVTGLSFADIDAGGAAVQVTLAVASGTLAATPSGAVTVGGTASALTLSGSVADINAFIAAAQVTFTTAPDADDDVILTVTIDDQGHTGSDPGTSGTATSEAETATLLLDVLPVNDAPVAPGVTLASIEADSGRVITQAELLATASDVDSPDLAAIDLAIAAGLGTLADNHDGTWTYTPAAGDSGEVTFSYRVTDGSASVPTTAGLDITQPPQAPGIPTTVGTPGPDGFTAPAGDHRFIGLGDLDTVTFDFRLTDATVTYQGNQIIVDTTTSHTVLNGIERFVFADGTVDNHDSDPLVDDLFYYSHNHDVWNAHTEADAHYHQFGWNEGRDPNAFFDTADYLARNADVQAAGVDPLTHFDQFGWKESRAPSVRFDAAFYLGAYADVKAAGVDPLAHFLQFGAAEGRDPLAPIAENGFDLAYYLQHNPDVAAAGVDPLRHFAEFGWKEGRNPNGLFDTDGYLATYADVRQAGINPLDHYHQFGWQEGRDPSIGFDTTDYLAAYPDVQAASLDPLVHYLRFGLSEGRSPFQDGMFG